MAKPRRKDSLVLYWEDGQLICEDYLGKERFAVTPEVVACLDALSPNRSPANPDPKLVSALKRKGLVRDRPSNEERALGRWRWGAAARHFFFATKGVHNHVSRAKRIAHARALLAAGGQPSPCKTYPRARQVALERPSQYRSEAAAALSRVRDVRQFSGHAITKEALSEILLLSAGRHGTIAAEPWGELLIKTHHSAGSRHPLELYAVATAVNGLPNGAYHYNVRTHALELVRRGEFDGECRQIAGGQKWVRGAAVYLFLSAIFDRTSFKYRHDAFLRSVFVDAGHASQSVYVSAAASGLGACTTHAVRHDLAEKLLGLDGYRESVLLMTCLGSPKPGEISLYRPRA